MGLGKCNSVLHVEEIYRLGGDRCGMCLRSRAGDKVTRML